MIYSTFSLTFMLHLQLIFGDVRYQQEQSKVLEVANVGQVSRCVAEAASFSIIIFQVYFCHLLQQDSCLIAKYFLSVIAVIAVVEISCCAVVLCS